MGEKSFFTECMNRINPRTGPLIPPVQKVTRAGRPDLDPRRKNPQTAPTGREKKPGTPFEKALAGAARDPVAPHTEQTHATIEELLARQGVILEDENPSDAQD